MRRPFLLAAGALGLVTLVACSGGGHEAAPTTAPPTTADPATRARSGGDATVHVAGAGAFSQPIPSLTTQERRAFVVGNNFFNDNWVTAPASTTGRDGLGPTFNAQSCSSCHFRDGRAQPPASDPSAPPELGLLLRLSVPGTNESGGPVADPVYGNQLQDRSIKGVPAEATVRITTQERRGTYGDGTAYSLLAPSYALEAPAFGPPAPDLLLSPRLAPPVFGVGLLEAISEEDIVAAADADDADGDGISGRPNRVPDPATGETALGRFGWKASVPTVRQQTAAAFHGDIGITSSVFPDQECTEAQVACQQAPDGGTPEIDDAKLERVVFYTRTLAVPARRDVGQPATDEGERLFTELGCASCHTPTMHTGDADVASLADQEIHPYTDLLLHDLGPDLADGRPDFEASGSEWRTAPLWGIGLTEHVNGHTRFLHDGRARNLAEAILWHGGEAEAARERFRLLPAEQRQALLDLVGSL